MEFREVARGGIQVVQVREQVTVEANFEFVHLHRSGQCKRARVGRRKLDYHRLGFTLCGVPGERRAHHAAHRAAAHLFDPDVSHR